MPGAKRSCWRPGPATKQRCASTARPVSGRAARRSSKPARPPSICDEATTNHADTERQFISDLVHHLADELGLHTAILYGSHDRGDWDAASDIDVPAFRDGAGCQAPTQSRA